MAGWRHLNNQKYPRRSGGDTVLSYTRLSYTRGRTVAAGRPSFRH